MTSKRSRISDISRSLQHQHQHHNIAIALSLALLISIHTYIPSQINHSSISQPNQTIITTMDTFHNSSDITFNNNYNHDFVTSPGSVHLMPEALFSRNNTYDNQLSSVHFTTQALLSRASRQSNQNRYTLPFRPRISSSSSALSYKETSTNFASLANELRLRHQERTSRMPRRERGRYWNWSMFPGARLGLPAQKDIENAKIVFEASLNSEETVIPEEYFSRGGPRVTVEDMRIHVEMFLEVYLVMLKEGNEKAKARISTQFLRDHASRVFTALARASNFVPMDVVIGTYEWIDEYLRVKFDLRANKDEALDLALPVLEIAESIRSRSRSPSEEENWYDALCEA